MACIGDFIISAAKNILAPLVLENAHIIIYYFTGITVQRVCVPSSLRCHPTTENSNQHPMCKDRPG